MLLVKNTNNGVNKFFSKKNKMTNEQIQNYFLDLESYKACLLEDFSRNPLFAKLASDMSGTDAPSIKDWVEGVQGKKIFYEEKSETFHYHDITPDAVKNIEYRPFYYPEFTEDNDPYRFFSYRIFDSYEAMERDYPREYYIFDYPDFFDKVESLIHSTLKDYKPMKQKHIKKCFTKKINERIRINLLLFSNVNKYSDVAAYSFPFVQLDIDGVTFPIITADPQFLLLLNRVSFIFFYFEQNIFENREILNQNFKMTRKTDQPVYYKEGDKFIVSNSIEKLEKYNKFIYMTMELFSHYFGVFEKWLIKRAEDLLTELNGGELC